MVAGFAVVGCGALAFVQRDSRPILATLLIAATIAELVAMAAFLVGPDIGVPVRGLLSTEVFDTRAFGPFFNSNYMGFFAAQAMLLAVGWATISRGWGRIALVVAAAVAAVALLATFSRGKFLGAAAGIIVLCWLHSRRLAIVTLALLALGAFVLYPIFIGTRLDITYGDTSNQAFADETQSEAWRLGTVEATSGCSPSSPCSVWASVHSHS